MKLRTAFGLLALAAALSACGSDPSNPTGDVAQPVLTAREAAGISSVVGSVATAYESRDLSAFETLCDSDAFRFVFDPIDVEEIPDLPAFWEWPDESLATAHLFADGDVSSISCTITPLDSPRRADPSDDPLHPGSVILLVQYELTVETEVNGEPIVLDASGRAVFFLLPTPTPDGNAPHLGDTDWKIVEWRDIRLGGSVTEEASWGSVKALFR